MYAAELVQFVVHLIVDESAVVLSGVVLHCVVHWKQMNSASVNYLSVTGESLSHLLVVKGLLRPRIWAV